jgi:hypothetical protein
MCAVSSNTRGLAHHQKRTMCVGFDETTRTSTVVASTSPQPGPDSDAVSDIDSFPSSHHSRVTHVSDTQPSRVLDTPREEGDDLTPSDCDVDYNMSDDEGEMLDPSTPGRRGSCRTEVGPLEAVPHKSSSSSSRDR